MARFYTCRAVVNPASDVPSVRLCLRPTVTPYFCHDHRDEPEPTKAAAAPVELKPVTEAKPQAAAAPVELDDVHARVRQRGRLWPED